MPSSGRYPRPPHGPRSRTAQRKQRPKPDPKKRSKGARLGGTALLLAPAPAREGDVRPARARVRLQLRPARRRLGLERDQRRPAELLRAEQRHARSSSQIKDKQQAVRAQPKNVNLYLDLAGLYQSDNQEANALATLRKARKVAPRNIDVLDRIARSTAARPAVRATTTATCFADLQPERDHAARARDELADRPGAHLGPVQPGAADAAQQRVHEGDHRLPEGRRGLQAGGPGREGNLEGAERAVAVGLGRPERERPRRPRSPPTSAS